MKTLTLILSFFLITSCMADTKVKEGIYFLKGHNPKELGQTDYIGGLIIEKDNATYRVIWMVGEQQAQLGVGLQSGKILSVGFVDASGQDAGVASFTLADDDENKISGTWSSIGSPVNGTEDLEYLGENTPKVQEKLKARISKEKSALASEII